jgi:hypothetical protein
MVAANPVVPARVSLEVRGHRHPVRDFELSGHRASLRTSCPLALEESAALRVTWSDGSTTTLPIRVRAVAPACDPDHASRDNVAHVDVEGVEGDWKPLLAYLGPTALAS